MAVYKRTYKAYEGALTPGWSRFLILPRSAYGYMMRVQVSLVVYLVACFFYPLGGCAAFIYISHNLTFLTASMNLPVGRMLKVDASFFPVFLRIPGRHGRPC